MNMHERALPAEVLTRSMGAKETGLSRRIPNHAAAAGPSPQDPRPSPQPLTPGP